MRLTYKEENTHKLIHLRQETLASWYAYERYRFVKNLLIEIKI
jgi:hypothetical protein